MKTILFAALLLGSNAFAGTTKFTMPFGMNTMYMVQTLELVSVKMGAPNCPPNARCMPAMYATVKVPLNGCLDRMGPVTAVVKNEGEKTVVYMTAFGVANPRSMTARCIAAAFAMVNVHVGGPAGERPEVEVRPATYMLNEAK